MHALWSARQLGALLLAYGGGFGAARLVDDAVAGIVGLLTGLAAGSLVYAMIFLALGGFNDRDRRRFGDVKRRVGNRRKSVPLTNVKEPGNA
jgi:hypothetical protein